MFIDRILQICNFCLTLQILQFAKSRIAKVLPVFMLKKSFDFLMKGPAQHPPHLKVPLIFLSNHVPSFFGGDIVAMHKTIT